MLFSEPLQDLTRNEVWPPNQIALLSDSNWPGQTPKKTMKKSTGGSSDLLKWCQNKTKQYRNVSMTSFSCASVQNGLLFVGILHHYHPDKIPSPDALNPNNGKHNRELAWNFAHKKLGIEEF